MPKSNNMRKIVSGKLSPSTRRGTRLSAVATTFCLILATSIRTWTAELFVSPYLSDGAHGSVASSKGVSH